jgi:hypothetical protein
LGEIQGGKELTQRKRRQEELRNCIFIVRNQKDRKPAYACHRDEAVVRIGTLVDIQSALYKKEKDRRIRVEELGEIYFQSERNL